MYHPADPEGGSFEETDFEFVELQNVGRAPVDLIGVRVEGGIVQMPDSRRYFGGTLPEHRYDVQVLHAVLNPDDSQGQSFRKRWSTISLGAGSFLISMYGVAPRICFAL